MKQLKAYGVVAVLVVLVGMLGQPLVSSPVSADFNCNVTINDKVEDDVRVDFGNTCTLVGPDGQIEGNVYVGGVTGPTFIMSGGKVEVVYNPGFLPEVVDDLIGIEEILHSWTSGALTFRLSLKSLSNASVSTKPFQPPAARSKAPVSGFSSGMVMMTSSPMMVLFSLWRTGLEFLWPSFLLSLPMWS